MKNRACLAVMVLMLSFILTASAWGKIIYVKSTATGLNNGSSWTNAYKDLQSALAAAVAPDEIWVAAATYKPTTGTNKNISFSMKPGVAMYGGFAGTETAPTQRNWSTRPTILSGEIGMTTTTTDNSLYVVVGAAGATLDGFTVRDGCGTALYNTASSLTAANCMFTSNNNWSAIYNTGTSQTVTNCSFIGNDGWEGGAICNSGSFCKVSKCSFYYNSANTAGRGGAIFNSGDFQTVSDCTFSTNTASLGGGIFNKSRGQIIKNCTFTGNTASSESVRYGSGGAIYAEFAYNDQNEDVTSQTVIRCTFTRNRCTNGGAGIFNRSANHLTTGCTFVGNYGINPWTNRYDPVYGEGGGMGNNTGVAMVVNSNFIENSAREGGAMWSCSAINCTLTNNKAKLGGGAYIGTLTNCTLTGNVAEQGGGANNSSANKCVFSQNTATVSGGGLMGVASNCIIIGNSAPRGGGAFSSNLSNCVVMNNSASMDGGGIYNDLSHLVTNCTIVNNTAGYSGGGLYFQPEPSHSTLSTTATNCIFWGNTAGRGGPDLLKSEVRGPGVLAVKNCMFIDWGWTTTGGINAGGNMVGLPNFVNLSKPTGVDNKWFTSDDGLALLKNSPAIDKGSAKGAPSTDIFGNARSGLPDIGAYEYKPPKNSARSWILFK